jgi:3-oxoacyl-[acyl-carrier protein] reductase
MNKEFSLEGRNIIVTGAGQGIGKAVSMIAIELGAKVVGVDLNAATIDTVQSELGADQFHGVVGSVADPETAKKAVESCRRHFGEVHGLVNNAGIIRPAMIEKMTVEAWAAVIDVHLTGSFHFLQAVGRSAIERAKDGKSEPCAIVNISSDAGRKGTIGQINYGAAKAGMFGLTMCAAREWAKWNIRVNTVAFGVVETPMTETIRSEKFRESYLAQVPLGRWADPPESARPVCFLLSDGASYITGQHLSVNGGYVISL